MVSADAISNVAGTRMGLSDVYLFSVLSVRELPLRSLDRTALTMMIKICLIASAKATNKTVVYDTYDFEEVIGGAHQHVDTSQRYCYSNVPTRKPSRERPLRICLRWSVNHMLLLLLRWFQKASS